MSEWRSLNETFAGTSIYNAGYQFLDHEDSFEVKFTLEKWPINATIAEPGAFYEGLWKGDCAEFWIYSAEAQKYLEFNLGPNGAWWTCVFTGPRVRDLSVQPPECETTSVEIPGTGWAASISVSKEEVFRCLGTLDNLRGNVTLLTDGCPDSDPPPENLHTAIPLGDIDFHRPQDWVPLEKLM